VNLAIVSMAWVVQQGCSSGELLEPDIDTLTNWVARLWPLIRAQGEREVIVVLANRCGTEAEAIYAGTSCVLGIKDGEVMLYGILGRGEEKLLVVDTTQPPQSKLVTEMNLAMPEDAVRESISKSSLARL
jgi:protein N-terminal amidase